MFDTEKAAFSGETTKCRCKTGDVVKGDIGNRSLHNGMIFSAQAM